MDADGGTSMCYNQEKLDSGRFLWGIFLPLRTTIKKFICNGFPKRRLTQIADPARQIDQQRNNWKA